MNSVIKISSIILGAILFFGVIATPTTANAAPINKESQISWRHYGGWGYGGYGGWGRYGGYYPYYSYPSYYYSYPYYGGGYYGGYGLGGLGFGISIY